MARFIGLPSTLPEEIGTVVRPVTMRCHVRHIGKRYFRTQAALSASLLDAMHSIRSFQDLTNDSAPSSRS